MVYILYMLVCISIVSFTTEIELLSQHGTMLPPDMVGLTDEQVSDRHSLLFCARENANALYLVVDTYCVYNVYT